MPPIVPTIPPGTISSNNNKISPATIINITVVKFIKIILKSSAKIKDYFK